MTNNEYQSIRSKALSLEKQKKGYLTYLCSTFSCDKAQARAIYDKLVNNEPISNSGTEDNVLKAEGYVYNQLNDKYIVPLKSYGRDYVCPGSQHRAMLAAYSNWQGGEKSIAQIARLYKMRREWVVEYFKIMGWTHDTVPITTEEIIQKKDREAIDRVLQTRRTELQQELEHADWKSTQADAEKWRLFEASKLDPFIRVIEKYSPRPFKPIKYKGSSKTVDETLLIGLSDLHFGSKANAAELYSGDDFDSEKIKDIMDSYFCQIYDEVSNRKKPFNEVVVCSLGDILHGLSGFTVKGTPLESDLLREEQFELALNSLNDFFFNLLTIFKKVTVYAVKGNHAGVGDWILFKTIETYFKNEPRIKFNLFKSRQGCFRVGTTAVLMDHGASDFAKSIMPVSGAPKEAYVQALFMEHPEILQGAKSKLMLTGDRHRFLQEEMRGFEHVTFGSCVSGDRYADNLGLHSRARQNCLVLNKHGIKEALSFYFD
jgi:hypothetical protein